MEEDIDLRVTPSPWSLYVIIGMFVLASTVALVGVLEPLFYMVPFGTARLPNYAFPCFYGSLEVRQVLLILFSIGLAFSWVVIRHNSKSWLLQDFLGVIFSIYMIKTLRLPNLMVICVLLVLLFFYDIFFVFVTPYLVPKGDSIMVEVARGGGSDEQIPMVLRVPHLSNEDISACFGEYSVLGFGDILIPGFLVAYVHSFDLIATQGCLYYVTSVTAYGVGLLVTFIGLYIMKMAQPALLYLVPATLIPVILIAWYRGELREIWYGLKPETPLPSEEEPETSTVPGKRKNSRDEEERHASSRPSTSTIETPTQTSVAPSPSAMFPVHRFPPRPLSLPVPYYPQFKELPQDKSEAKLMTPNQQLTGLMFTKEYEMDASLILVWFIATFSVAAGAFWAGTVSDQIYRYHVYRARKLAAMPSRRAVVEARKPSQPAAEAGAVGAGAGGGAAGAGAAAREGGAAGAGAVAAGGDVSKRDVVDTKRLTDTSVDDIDIELTPVGILVFVIFMSSSLVVIYLLIQYLVYVIIGMFVLASSVALIGVLEPLVHRLPVGTTKYALSRTVASFERGNIAHNCNGCDVADGVQVSTRLLLQSGCMVANSCQRGWAHIGAKRYDIVIFRAGCRVVPSSVLPCFYVQLEVRQVCVIVLSVGVAFSFVVIRHNPKSWLLQDALGIIFCVYMIKTLRMPNLMVIWPYA
ncbi:hypothetical protein HPB52_004713 [Rhipicephalus sanguineus]|uniref:Signal peptide peptidase-like 2B n=1 Tax=Rhipicephalus sanguineus TaxID=34632 RepID=A0A9D4SVQ5_RHISA|nr:hypothetical protein HPB52_004713 [Rhipicephalus sanguineus]